MAQHSLAEAINTLRTMYDNPPSDLSIIRNALNENLDHVKLLNAEQRQVFKDRLDLLHEFLESEDGADAVQLLTNTFEAFADQRRAAAE